MSRGLSRQQVAILLLMRQREEECYRRYVYGPHLGKCRCGEPSPTERFGDCYQHHQRWCSKCTTNASDITIYFWPQRPKPKAEYLQALEDDPEFRAWTEGLERMAAAIPTRHDVYVNYVHHTSAQRALRGLYSKGLIGWARRTKGGRCWFTRWRADFTYYWTHRAPSPASLNRGPRVSVVSAATQHLPDASMAGVAP